MEFEYGTVKSIAAKVITAGTEITDYIGRSRGVIERTAQGNDGFASAKALSTIAKKLVEDTLKAAGKCADTGQKVVESAENYRRTESTVKSEVNLAKEYLGAVPGM
ncbi:hypothetical protein Afil01_65910 [Actinorhabdospora filicis]|uniref:Uncharacterized protein n=1 Tax=Actinorhabdospora filicis TaxID=1785913 RepID=A0A9W6WCM4_9ACTN|nr:hypothetical protein [Actinorhabdospora filicis]GLZ81784.1 hypothetical protein Afil01_65910 [Actinorhabdospora filicis]